MTPGATTYSTSRRRLSFWTIGAMLAVSIASTTAPSILYRRYQATWHFSDGVLTAVFGVYALAVIAALLVAGAASDTRGRKPSILASVGLGVLSMSLFIAARGVWWLVAARLVQGAGVGLGLGALGGMLLDLRPNGPLAAFLNQAAPNVGIVLGALVTGALVDHAPHPTSLIYLVLLVLFLASAPLLWILPETSTPSPATHRRLQRISLPAGRQREFFLLSLGAIATWAVGGFYLSLSPTISAKLLGKSSYTVDGIAIAVLGAAAILAQVTCYRWTFERGMMVGAMLLGLGTAGVVYSLWPDSPFFFFGGSVLLSLGWGLTAVGSFRSLTSLADPGQRAEVVAAVYVVSYLAFSLPSMAAGVALPMAGLRPTTAAFGAAVTVMAVIAAITAVRSPRTRQ